VIPGSDLKVESLGATPNSNEEMILAVRHAWIKKRPDRSQGSSHKLFARIIRLTVEPWLLTAHTAPLKPHKAPDDEPRGAGADRGGSEEKVGEEKVGRHNVENPQVGRSRIARNEDLQAALA
jgi:hypothetical protein